MKVTILSPTINPENGYGNITYNLCKHISKFCRVTLLLPKNSSIETNLKHTKILKILPQPILNIKDKEIINYIFWKLPNIDADLIHSLFAFPYAILGHSISKKYSLPFITGAQGTYGIRPLTTFPEKYYLARAYNHATTIHVPSNFTKQHILKFSHTNTPIRIIANGIDLSNIRRSFQDKKLSKSFGPGPILVGAGALKNRKGFDIVIKAIKKLVNKYPDIKYLIAGEGSSRYQLKKLVNKLNLNNHVILLGHSKHSDIIKLMHFCDLCVHTPRSDFWKIEGFGIVYLEAAACGKPTVASRSGGVSSAIMHNQTGILVKEGSVTQTAQAIDKLLSNKGLYEKMSQQSILWAKKHDWKVIGRQYLNMYRDILK